MKSPILVVLEQWWSEACAAHRSNIEEQIEDDDFTDGLQLHAV
jgi:hypothetical protein